MKIAILGGGVTGLTTGFLLQQKGHEVALIEKETVLGGMASGIRQSGWEWPLEKSYHHIFSNDADILDFSREIGYQGFVFFKPETASLYRVDNNYRTFTVDTPQDFLRFPLMSLPEKIRAGAVIAFLKISPHLSLYEKQTASGFLKKSMGKRAWNILWEQLFRKKFGKYAENILTSFIWARITKRTKNLGYPDGGFQSFVDHLERVNRERGVEIYKGKTVLEIRREKSEYSIVLDGGEVLRAESVISTLPTQTLMRIGKNIFPSSYLAGLGKIRYSHAISFIIESDERFLDRAYWVSLCDPDAPMTVLVQHTNLIEKKHYNNRHILYIGNYINEGDVFYGADPDTIYRAHMSYLYKITGRNIPVRAKYFFRIPFAQPLYERHFPRYMPRFDTPLPNFHIANLDMTYPYDRGTNFAVRLGIRTAGML